MALNKATTGEDPTFKFILSVLTSCEAIKPDWGVVARNNGYGYARNAQSRFKDILKKQGFKFESGKIVDLDGTGTNSVTASESPKTPKTPKTSRKTGDGKPSNGSGKKRTAAEMTDDEIGPKETDAVNVKDQADIANDEV